ncbi:MAG: SWIM zinc finger family protein [Tepidisphaeraceae bacterium]
MGRWDNGYGGFPDYVPAAQRRANALKEMDRFRAKGKVIQPIEIESRLITRTFWGNAWCKHIECLSDFASRLERGRTLVRNGSVCHLEIKTGKVEAFVAGTELYSVGVEIQPLPAKRWESIKRACAGQIGTQVELLQGKFSDNVMRVLTDPDTGMFPHADDFDLDCSCPDFARLCKHLAAALYGVGARLDESPELLFTLRGVDPFELVDQSMNVSAVTRSNSTSRDLASDDLAAIFGIELDLTGDARPNDEKTAASKVGRKAMKAPVNSKPKKRDRSK